MVKKIIWSENALKDLVNILSYWNKRNKSNSYSLKLYKLFNDTISAVINFPSLGKNTNVINVKKIIAKDYYIIYEDNLEEIHVLRIWDTRQDPSKLKY